MQPVVVGDYRDGPARRTCVFDILAIWFPWRAPTFCSSSLISSAA
jgi:hypothetical protein